MVCYVDLASPRIEGDDLVASDVSESGGFLAVSTLVDTPPYRLLLAGEHMLLSENVST